MSAHDSFIVDTQEDPHKLRRKALLESYPEISSWIGYEKKTKYIVGFLIIFQLVLAWSAQTLPFVGWLMVVYGLGATLNHSLFTVIHEVSHNLLFKTKRANRCFGLLVNLPLGLPAAMGFEKYHLLHHRFMGCLDKDVDIPLLAEAHCFNSTVGKFFWLILQPLTYTLRPFIKYPQKITSWEWLNIGVQLVFDVAIVLFLGVKVFAFLILSTVLGMSLHPVAMHFIAEHYVAHEQQESYSYYGLLNRLTFNVGYHVEHHDFPGIPWSRIKKLKQIAPEYYTNLYTHASWIKFMWVFIFSKKINLFSRKIRTFQ